MAKAVAIAMTGGASEPVDEALLIRAAQRGDQEAFAAPVRAHDQGVLRLAVNRMRSVEDARHVCKEAFLRVHRNLP